VSASLFSWRQRLPTSTTPAFIFILPPPRSIFLLGLLAAVEPRAINASLVTAGETPEEREKNAKYVLSVARKLGATVFLTWEDIVDVKPKVRRHGGHGSATVRPSRH
jgi:hypothetical protein